MGSKFRAVVFDMDGVLVDSEPLHGKAWTRVLTALDIPLEEGWFVEYIGIPDHVLADNMAAAHRLPIDKPELLARKRTIYEALVPVELVAFPGVVDGLDALNGAVMAVATGSGRRDATQCLTAADMLERFAVVVTADDVERHKPDPLPYLRAAELLRVPPDTCIVVEDSAPGIEAARKAGCGFIIGVTTAHTPEALDGADAVVPTMAEAMERLRNLLA